MCLDRGVFYVVLLYIVMSVGKERNGDVQETTEKETRPEYIHPDGLLNFDPYLSDIKPEPEEDDYIPLPENEETIDGLPIFLVEPKNSYVLRTRPASMLCRAANALEVYFKCNGVRSDKAVQLEHVDPQNGVRVVEAELNVTRNEIDEYFGGKFGCECYAWNSKGKIRSQAVFIEYAYIKKQFSQHPQSATVEAGRSITLRCSPPPAAPPADLRWTRNGALLDVREDALQLSNVGLQDMANYTCVAENIAGRRESDAAVISVYVNGGWSEWSAWLPCRCGARARGRRRSRGCAAPAPANGGAPCRGPPAQTDGDCLTCPNGGGGAWSAWGGWSACGAGCVRARRRACAGAAGGAGGAGAAGGAGGAGAAGGCAGPALQHAACVDGLCASGLRLNKTNFTLYVGIGITVTVLMVAAAILYVWCRYRNTRTGYTSARSGVPKTYPVRDKAVSGPDLTRSCNEYWMQGADNHYDMPHVRDSYSSPFGSRGRQTGSAHYEMKPYSPSGDSASSCCTNSRTMTSRSSECSSPLAELMSTPSSAKVDVAVTLPPVPLDSSYREKICLTVVK